MSNYNYTDGDGLAVIEATTPDGATEPVSVLDDAVRQIKAYLLDPTKGPQALIDAINSSEVGIIKMFGGSAIPASHLLCNGAAVSRTTYAALFAVIGVGYGPGDSVTTFNLPPAPGRSPIGVGVTDADADFPVTVALGQKLGDGGVMMTEDMLVAHVHSIPVDGSGNHADGNAAGGSLAGLAGGSTGSTGNGTTAIPTVTPSFGVNFIIRY